MSTDNTSGVIENIKDSRIKIFHNNLNQSCSSSLNFGLKLIEEEIVVRADGDNVYSADYVETLLNHIKKDKIVYSPYREIRKNKSSYIVEGFKDIEPFLWTMLFCNTVDHNVAYYKDFVLKKGGYSNLPCSEDYKLWTDCLLEDKHSIVCVNTPNPKVTTIKTQHSLTSRFKEVNNINIKISQNFINNLLNIKSKKNFIKKLKEAKIYGNKITRQSDMFYANYLAELFFKKFNVNNNIIKKYKDYFYFYV